MSSSGIYAAANIVPRRLEDLQEFCMGSLLPFKPFTLSLSPEYEGFAQRYPLRCFCGWLVTLCFLFQYINPKERKKQCQEVFYKLCACALLLIPGSLLGHFLHCV